MQSRMIKCHTQLLQLPRYSELGIFEVTLSDAIKAPYFIHGVHTDYDWETEIRDNPAPWAEFEMPGNIIFTVASSYIR